MIRQKKKQLKKTFGVFRETDKVTDSDTHKGTSVPNVYIIKFNPEIQNDDISIHRVTKRTTDLVKWKTSETFFYKSNIYSQSHMDRFLVIFEKIVDNKLSSTNPTLIAEVHMNRFHVTFERIVDTNFLPQTRHS